MRGKSKLKGIDRLYGGLGVKVRHFDAEPGVARAGYFYRVDEPGRKGEWLGPYPDEQSARVEATWSARRDDCDCDEDEYADLD
jgi:hypothetical protein